MKTIQHLISLAALLATALLAPAAVPSAINYQGRLTNASGVPQTGSKAMSLKIYDAATSGTLLYAETLGSVAVDANGVYGFQFGASGTSDTLVTETLATTDGSSTTYQKALSNTPVVAGTVSVTDGTYSWNELTGNPGSPASATATTVSGFVVGATVTSGGSGYTSAPSVTITGNGSNATATATVSSGAVTAINITNAGSGYTTGATITIAPPPAPFTVSYTGGTITTTYATAPAAGQSITATYRYSASGISGALVAGSEQWLELTVDGVAQSPRQKVLAVPFAMVAQSALSATDQQARQSITDLAKSIANNSFATSYATISSSVNSSPPRLGKIASAARNDLATTVIDLGIEGRFLLRADTQFLWIPSCQYFGGYLKFYYKDGTDWTESWSQMPTGDRVKRVANPNPTKRVIKIEARQDYTSGSFNPTYNGGDLSATTNEIASLTFSCSITASKVLVVPQTTDALMTDKTIRVLLSNGSSITGEWNQWIVLPISSILSGIEVKARVLGEGDISIPSIKVLYP